MMTPFFRLAEIGVNTGVAKPIYFTSVVAVFTHRLPEASSAMKQGAVIGVEDEVVPLIPLLPVR